MSLVKIQNELKAPKSRNNSFGKYKYRSCEDILEAVKPLLEKYNATVIISDNIIEIAGTPVINATVNFKCGEESYVVTAQAGIDISKKGMDISQTFGSSSSYARKYALNGLFLIDDTKDADTDEHQQARQQPQAPKKDYIPQDAFNKALEGKYTPEQVETKYILTPQQRKQLQENAK